MVLWLLALLGLLVGFFMQRSHLELLVTHNFMEDSRGSQEARAGINEGIRLLLADDNDHDSLADPWAVAAGNDRYALSIVDEGSRINLNAMPEAVLGKLPGILPEELAALLDWRDLDDQTREGGAEDSYYMGLAEPYHAANGRFEVKEELKLVKGIPEIYDSWVDLVTVYGPLNVNTAAVDGLDALLASCGVDKFTAQFILNELIFYRRQGPPVTSLEEWRKKMPSMTEEIFEKIRPDLTVEGTINVNTASREVLLTIFRGLNLSDAYVDQLISARGKVAFTDLFQVERTVFGGNAAAFNPVKNFLTTRSSYFTIEARAKRGTGARNVARVTVYRYHPTGEGKKWRIKILSWEE